MSFKKSLRILLIISSMIPVVLVSVVAHGLLTNKLIDVNTHNLQRSAETSKQGLEAMLKTQQTEVSLLSIQDELTYLTTISNEGRDVAPDAVNKLLQNRKALYEHCERISLYNLDHEIIASSDPELIGTDTNSEITLSHMMKTKSIAVAVDNVKPLSKAGDIIYTLEIGSPIMEPGSNNVIGYVISTIGTSYFREFLNSISFGETGFGILLDADGTILYHPNLSSVGKNINYDKLSNLISSYQQGEIKASGHMTCFYENTNQAYGYCILPSTNWILFVKQDIAEIRSITTIILALLFLICTILMVLIVISANILAKKISTPIIALRDAMRIASDGNLTVQSNIKSNNEFGELSKNFNKMLHIIKTNYEDLESMHEELLSNEEQLRANYDHIEFLAYHDTLTNLPNKLAFLDYANAVLVSSPPEQSMHAVYFVDLDNFKTINDTLGHEYGDALLVKTSQVLSSIINGAGMLARAGGDEFLLFKENVGSKDHALDFASLIIDHFKDPLDLDGEVVYVSMSIGISLYPDNGLSPNALIKNADIAMYKSKDTGKNKFTLFDSKMEEELNRNTIIIEVLRNAIDNNEVYIQYQPLMELNTNNVIGFEALMRINSERLGFLTPGEFIPIAEESGLIVELSSWLIKEACMFNKSLIDKGATPRPVSVNISSVQINRPGFVAMLSDILAETQLPPQYLELEITESTLVSSIMDATMLLKTLQNIGVKVSLDDFGTGYSSLNYLTKLPINTLKIDKSFIDNICVNDKDSCIAESIIQLAHSLDIRVVAEGVEHENQLALLRAQHCDIIQGYIFSKPLHPAELVDIIEEDDLITQFSLF
ncbi:EAL domain-containing protein [Lachnospiraceae bacterium MD1]|jgi:diguanylate cyclase (GGDEF)-like protein|uniref:EAL domain-containing protein n=1 Tax=Variimorphobacter saccharofermentans TaxID=2755051 RepID=A0A839K619_9FIRM|nr:EAL domain-containing protein [Variimorphobacter saccharofermentans]MBB2184111.1 EAL domain-containing protein [Variimorphobacter saccharofermentans]